MLNLAALTAQEVCYDTTYYKRYHRTLTVSSFYSIRRFDLPVSQKMTTDTKLPSNFWYRSESRLLWGAQIDFNKLSLSFGIPIGQEQIATKGKNDYFNLGIGYGGEKWFLEAGYNWFKGFYDTKTGQYDTTIKTTGKYYQDSRLENRLVKGKLFYFKNFRKYSCKAGYCCTYRQLKPAFSWVFSGNLYDNRISTDSSLIPRPLRLDYGSFYNLNEIRTQAISVGGGLSGTMVIWKRLFVNAMWTVNPELQFRKYGHQNGESANYTFISASMDFRIAVGYNGERFFMTLKGIYDNVYFNSSQMEIRNQLMSGSFSVGYRIRLKSEKIYEKYDISRVTKWAKRKLFKTGQQS